MLASANLRDTFRFRTAKSQPLFGTAFMSNCMMKITYRSISASEKMFPKTNLKKPLPVDFNVIVTTDVATKTITP